MIFNDEYRPKQTIFQFRPLYFNGVDMNEMFLTT